MSDLTPILLTPTPIGLDAPEFQLISDWPFPDSYVSRMLRDDIPERVRRGTGRIWIYRDPDGQLVGLGTLDVPPSLRRLHGGKGSPYIPLLAVNPTIASRGYGTSIVRHLTRVAHVLAGGPGGIDDVLFLDVYVDNERALRLYERCGFQVIETEPIPDPEEGGRRFLIMALRVSGARAECAASPAPSRPTPARSADGRRHRRRPRRSGRRPGRGGAAGPAERRASSAKLWSVSAPGLPVALPADAGPAGIGRSERAGRRRVAREHRPSRRQPELFVMSQFSPLRWPCVLGASGSRVDCQISGQVVRLAERTILILEDPLEDPIKSPLP